MTASRLFPKVYNGKEESGGYLYELEERRTPKSPHWRGRVYLAGVGWFWLSGWNRKRSEGEVISLSLKGLTDEEAHQYCAPRRSAREKTAEKSSPNNTGGNDGDIPY